MESTGGSLTVRRTLLKDNYAGSFGGAISAQYKGDLHVFDSEFLSNSAQNGGALHLNELANIVIIEGNGPLDSCASAIAEVLAHLFPRVHYLHRPHQPTPLTPASPRHPTHAEFRYNYGPNAPGGAIRQDDTAIRWFGNVFEGNVGGPTGFLAGAGDNINMFYVEGGGSGCPAGQYGECSVMVDGGGQLFTCERDVCESCPPGRVTADMGAVSESDCLPCPKGLFALDHGASQCDSCPAGSYATDSAEDDNGIGVTSGASACQICPAGRISTESGSASCTACSAGETSLSGETQCVACPSGSFSAIPASPACEVCDAGKAAAGTGNVACVRCSAGTAAGSNAAHCDACGPGRASTTTGSAACVDCEVRVRDDALLRARVCRGGDKAARVRERACARLCAHHSTRSPLIPCPPALAHPGRSVC